MFKGRVRGAAEHGQDLRVESVNTRVALGPLVERRVQLSIRSRFIGADSFVGSGASQQLQTDPLTGNRYLYAGANPANLIDDGHKPQDRSREGHCKSYQAGRIRDYMTGRLGVPCGFFDFAKYAPVGVDGRYNPNGSCSTKGLVAEDTVRAFTDACKSHDYAYDLLRFAKTLGDGPVGRFRFSDRREADAQFNSLMGAVCGRAGYIARWNKARCQGNRAAIYGVVRGWTSIERSGL